MNRRRTTRRGAAFAAAALAGSLTVTLAAPGTASAATPTPPPQATHTAPPPPVKNAAVKKAYDTETRWDHPGARYALALKVAAGLRKQVGAGFVTSRITPSGITVKVKAGTVAAPKNVQGVPVTTTTTTVRTAAAVDAELAGFNRDIRGAGKGKYLALGIVGFGPDYDAGIIRFQVAHYTPGVEAAVKALRPGTHIAVRHADVPQGKPLAGPRDDSSPYTASDKIVVDLHNAGGTHVGYGLCTSWFETLDGSGNSYATSAAHCAQYSSAPQIGDSVLAYDNAHTNPTLGTTSEAHLGTVPIGGTGTTDSLAIQRSGASASRASVWTGTDSRRDVTGFAPALGIGDTICATLPEDPPNDTTATEDCGAAVTSVNQTKTYPDSTVMTGLTCADLAAGHAYAAPGNSGGPLYEASVGGDGSLQAQAVGMLVWGEGSFGVADAYCYVGATDTMLSMPSLRLDTVGGTVTLPTAPGNFTAEANANGTASLSWDPSTGTFPTTQYLVEWRTPAGSGTWQSQNEYATSYTSRQSSTVGGLTPGVTYQFSVAGISAAGTGPFANVITDYVPQTLISDAFNRADTTSGLGVADSGQTWQTTCVATTPCSTPGVKIGSAKATGIGASVLTTKSWLDTGQTTYDVTATATGSPSTSDMYLIVRYGTQSYWAVYGTSGGKWGIARYDAGSWCSGCTVLSTIPAVSGDKIKVTVNPGQITLFVNGVKATSTTDTTYNTSTKVGFVKGSGSAASSWDDLQAQDTHDINGVAPILYDDFNRSDTTTGLGMTVDGKTWGGETSQFKIASNKGKGIYDGNTTNGTSGHTALIDLGKADYTMQATYSSAVTCCSWQRWGLIFRYKDANNFWMIAPDSGNHWCVDKMVNGSLTTVIQTIRTPVVGDVMTIKTSGSNIWAYQSGALFGSAGAQTDFQAETKVGIRVGSGLTSGVPPEYDDIIAAG